MKTITNSIQIKIMQLWSFYSPTQNFLLYYIQITQLDIQDPLLIFLLIHISVNLAHSPTNQAMLFFWSLDTSRTLYPTLTNHIPSTYSMPSLNIINKNVHKCYILCVSYVITNIYGTICRSQSYCYNLHMQ